MKSIEMKDVKDLKSDALIPLEEREESKMKEKESLAESESERKVLRDEHIGMIVSLISAFFDAFGAFWTKVIQRMYPTKFHTVPFLFLRSFTIMIIALGQTWYYGLKIIPPHKLPLKKWFFFRTNSNFFGMSFFTISLWYLRASTAQMINSASPVLVFVLSYFILKENFYKRYIIGLIMCIFGSFLIISNEHKSKSISPSEEKAESKFSDILKGLICGILSMVNVAFVITANKVLASNKVPVNNQLFYVGVCTSTYSFIYVLFFGGVELAPGYLLCCCIHGIFFYIKNTCYNYSLQKAPVSKLIIISYTQIIFVFVLAWLFLSEPIFFTDLLGAVIMLSYMIYNAMNPIKDNKK